MESLNNIHAFYIVMQKYNKTHVKITYECVAK
jgi:hypothetical protein